MSDRDEHETPANSPDMTDAEREMLASLEQDDEQPQSETSSAQSQSEAPVDVHPVDVEPLKESRAAASPNADANLKLILDLPVDVKVEVGGSRLTIREVLNLAAGSVIELDRAAGSAADIIVNGTPVGQGDVVVVEENYGIRITRLVNPEDRLNSL